jgi:hypothetical protein
LLVFAVGLVLAVPASHASAVGWLPQVNVSAVDQGASMYDLSFQDVAVDGQGNAVAAWIQPKGSVEIVEAATRPLGGAWSSPVAVSHSGEDVLALKVVVDPQGDAAAIWIGVGAGNKQVVRVATCPAAGDWTEPVALSEVDGFAHEPDIAIDTQGTVTAVWSEGDVNDYGVVHVASRPADGDWSASVELSDGQAIEPQVAVDPEGNVTAAWTLLSADRGDGIIQSNTRPSGGDWSAEAVDVSADDGLAEHPRLAVDAQGEATAVWHRRDIPAGSGFKQFVQTARRVAGTWSAPTTISRDDGLAGNPEVTVDPEGNATAIWSWFPLGPGPRAVQARSRTADGTWDSPVDLVTKSGSLEPSESDLQVAADSQGNVTAIWTAWASPTLVVRSARRAVGGGWSAPVDVSGPAAYSIWPQMAIDPQGYATVVWSGFQGTTQAVRSRVLDPVPPELRDVTVPVSGVVGQPVAMSVDPFDVWSPVTTSWGFGDGSSGAGTAVSHCYSTPGQRPVTITGTDQVANATSASQMISIEPNPAFAPGVDPCGPKPPDPPSPPGPPDPPGRSDSNPDLGPAAPVVSALRQSSSRWRTQDVRHGSRLPVGTTFRFQLDRPARVRLVFLRVAPGRRDQARGAVEMAGKTGANTYDFRGKIRGRTLAHGRYRLLVTALADGKGSAVASIGFTIAR